MNQTQRIFAKREELLNFLKDKFLEPVEGEDNSWRVKNNFLEFEGQIEVGLMELLK